MKKVSIGDVSLNVVDLPGGGVPILFVHGFPLDHTMWQYQLEHFGSRQRVIAPDLRGFGRSDVTAGTVTMEQHADDLAALLDALQITQPIVFCGLSMGGYIGWQFWRKHRSRLAAFVQCDTRAVADSPEAAENRLKLAERVLREGGRCVAEAMLSKLFAPDVFAARVELATETRVTMEATPREGIAAALRGMAVRPDVTAWLPEIEVPILLIVGEHDAISTAAEMQGIADAIPDAAWVVVPGAGHMTPLESPQVFNEALEEFLML